MPMPMSLSMQTRNLSMGSDESDTDTIPLKENYEPFHQNAPACRPLESHEVTFGLAIALIEIDLRLVSHHCRRWGILAPISIAVWTDLSPEAVMDKLASYENNECDPEQMTIATLSPGHSVTATAKTTTDTTSKSETYPLNQLRNLAIQGLQTTHAVYLDIEILASADLYDSLHSPSTVKELAKNPKLAIVIPAFEVVNHCSSYKKKCFQSIPITFESLIMQLSEKKARIMGSHDIALQGSTLYRLWVQQEHGELASIDCVSSDYYEPFLAVRYCEGMPPFQEVLTHNNEKNSDNGAEFTDDNDDDDAKHDLTSTWILHLLRLGYRFEQVGGGFVVNLPPIIQHKESLAEKPKADNIITTEEGDDATHNSSLDYLRKTRIQEQQPQQFTRQRFLEWLHQTVPNHQSIQKCDDFEESGDEIF